MAWARLVTKRGWKRRKPRTRGGWKLSAPSEPKGALRRTPRVLGLLYELFDNEWTHSGHLKALDFGEKTDRLLLRMAQHHLVSRLTLDWGWKAPPVGGQPPQLYELAPLGAYDLAAAGMISAEQLREWERERAKREATRADNPKATHPLLRHQIANADVTVWFHQACAAHGYGFERGDARHVPAAALVTRDDEASDPVHPGLRTGHDRSLAVIPEGKAGTRLSAGSG